MEKISELLMIFLSCEQPAWQPRSRMFQESVLGGGRPGNSKESRQQHGLPGAKGEKGDAGVPGEHGRPGAGGQKGERGQEGKEGERGISVRHLDSENAQHYSLAYTGRDRPGGSPRSEGRPGTCGLSGTAGTVRRARRSGASWRDGGARTAGNSQPSRGLS